MSDTVPARLITDKAREHAAKASAALDEVDAYSHTSKSLDAAKAHIAHCVELLAMVAPQPYMLPVTPHDWPAPPDMAQIEVTQ